jgi:DNA uptake protein ComE-like DNA-binding protein
VTAGIAVAGAGLALARSVSFAQDASSTPATTSIPSGAAAWTRFNLNSANNDQFATIPGVGDRMLDEFNEYKPYSSILQFRKEIGKYVDDSVVAAYEAYLFVPVDPNTADSDTLQQLPGVSSDIADQLLSAVPYADDAAFVAALGSLVSADFAALASQYLSLTASATATWLKFNLNTASDDQFLTIPGVGDKMLGEFNEYKPYTSIEQFRQEIGKYVDDSQVAAWERYVYVPVDPANADAATLQQLPGVSEDDAKSLAESVPYADAAAFSTALASVVSPEQAALAGSYIAQ